MSTILDSLRGKTKEPTPDPRVAELEARISMLQEDVRRLIAERDEAFELQKTSQMQAEQFRDLSHTLRGQVDRLSSQVQTDVTLIGRLIAKRMSATGIIGVCHQVLSLKTTTSAVVAGALLTGYSEATTKEAAPDGQ